MEGSRAIFPVVLHKAIAVVALAARNSLPPPQDDAYQVTMNGTLLLDILKPPPPVGSVWKF